MLLFSLYQTFVNFLLNFYEKIPNTYFMPFYRLILSNSSCREAHRQSSRNRAMARQRSRVQAFGHQHTHAPRVQKLRNASFLQNRREDTIQAERHTDNA